MSKKQNTAPLNSNPYLIKPKEEVANELATRIKRGEEIVNIIINTEEDLNSARNQHEKWHDYNITYLEHSFTRPDIAKSYSNRGVWNIVDLEKTLDLQIQCFKKKVQDRIRELESILEKLSIYQEFPEASEITALSRKTADELNNVFIVHGHDALAKTQVARFIEKLKLKAVILHEQANGSQTLIDKFEKHALSAGFAIILLTADDFGYSKTDGEEKAKPRARQNVIFELGYFLHALKRSNVCVLYQQGVELPSDIIGVTYTLLDNDNAWECKLAKEMRTAGLKVDMNFL